MTPEADDTNAFGALGLRSELTDALAALGYEEPTPIQAEAIPPLLDRARPARPGRHRHRQDRGVRAADPASAWPPATGARPPPRSCWCPPASWPCRSPRPCTATAAASAPGCCRSTAASPSAASCTPCTAASTSSSPRPGRAVDHLQRGSLDFEAIEIVVLDEADEMLDMGFAEDIEAILDALPDQTPDGAVLGHDAAAHREDGAQAPHRPGPHHDRGDRGPRGRGAAGAPDRLRGARARTRPPRSAASSTSRRPPPRSCSAAPATRSTSSPRRSTAAATAPRRCTAA